MAEYTNARSYPVELNTGRMLAPGATANIDAENAHNLALITAQDLILYDSDTPPEDPDDLYVNVARRTFVADEGLTPPATADRGGDIVIGADGVIGKRDAAGTVTPHLSVVTSSWTGLAAQPDLLITGTITRDVDGAALGADVVWPDGDEGTYTGTASTEFPGAIDSYTITKEASPTVTFTQPAVTRDANGAVTVRPTITVA